MVKRYQNQKFGCFLLAWVLLPLIRCMIKVKGFQWTCYKVHDDPFKELPVRSGSTPADAIPTAYSIHAAVLRAGRYWPKKRNNCLQRASVACFLIRIKNIPCCIKLGVKENKTRTMETAHAWVEVLGQPIGESSHVIENFVPFNFNQGANA